MDNIQIQWFMLKMSYGNKMAYIYIYFWPWNELGLTLGVVFFNRNWAEIECANDEKNLLVECNRITLESQIPLIKKGSHVHLPLFLFLISFFNVLK